MDISSECVVPTGDVDCGGEANLDGLSTRDVVARFIVPLTTDHTNHNHGYSYINWRHKKDDTLSQTAEVYVIHAWDAMFLDVFESLLEYENREKERLLVLKERQEEIQGLQRKIADLEKAYAQLTTGICSVERVVHTR